MKIALLILLKLAAGNQKWGQILSLMIQILSLTILHNT